MELRGNSLVGKGRICVVGMKREQHIKKHEEPKDGRVNALVLLPTLQNLQPGWNKVNEKLVGYEIEDNGVPGHYVGPC